MQIKKEYVICLSLLSISIVYLFYTSKIKITELYQNKETIDPDIEIVVARYNEDLDWLRDEMFNNLTVTIYNKGTNDTFYKPPNLKRIVQLPNVGVCDHTYLYHIFSNYDDLANVTIFLPGSCLDRIKAIKTLNVLNETIKTKNSMFHGYYQEKGLLDSMKDFIITAYETQNMKNRSNISNYDIKTRRCDVYPFGKWFTEVFGNIFVNYSTYYGVFSVSKEHIQSRSKYFYEKLMSYVNKNINEECSHFMERSYIAIFNPPIECIRVVKVMNS
jgi:hypothetical protein